MEVPYLDALRTMTNRTLPLTDIEADEFGLPEQRLSDFASALEWSPMELLPESGVKGVWQIVRTGLNDSEVFAYESAKWVERCGPAAYLAIEGGQGHFVSGAVGLRQQATDLAVVEAFLTNF
jgi:protease II